MIEFKNNLNDIANFLKLLYSKKPKSFKVNFIYESKKNENRDKNKLKFVKDELREVENIFLQKENDFEYFKNELNQFNEMYIRTVGKKLLKLEKLKASKEPQRVNREYENENLNKSNIEVKEFYKRVIKKVHPDLSICEEEKSFREEITKNINMAKDENDFDKMQEFYEEFIIYENSNRDEVNEDDLIKNYKNKIHKMKKKMTNIENEIEKFKSSDLFDLYQIYKEDNSILDKVLNRIELEIEELSRC